MPLRVARLVRFSMSNSETDSFVPMASVLPSAENAKLVIQSFAGGSTVTFGTGTTVDSSSARSGAEIRGKRQAARDKKSGRDGSMSEFSSEKARLIALHYDAKHQRCQMESPGERRGVSPTSSRDAHSAC